LTHPVRTEADSFNSKADFDAALATSGKYVLIYAYATEISPKAEEYVQFSFQTNTRSYPSIRHFTPPLRAPKLTETNRAADKHIATTEAYKVDTDKYPAAKAYFGIETLPTVVVYKDGKELKKVEGVNEDNAKEIASVLV